MSSNAIASGQLVAALPATLSRRASHLRTADRSCSGLMDKRGLTGAVCRWAPCTPYLSERTVHVAEALVRVTALVTWSLCRGVYQPELDVANHAVSDVQSPAGIDAASWNRAVLPLCPNGPVCPKAAVT